MHKIYSVKNAPYYLAAVAAYSLWGLFSLALRPLSGVMPLDIMFYRVLLCFAVLSVLVLSIRKQHAIAFLEKWNTFTTKEKRYWLKYNFVAGLLLAFNWAIFIYVMNYVSVRATSLAYLVCPLLTAALGGWILKEYLSKIQKMALAVAAIGLVVIGNGHWSDMLLSGVVALSYAVYLVMQRRNLHIDPVLMLFFHIGVGVLFIAPFYPIYHVPFEFNAVFWVCIAAIVVLFTIVPLWLNLFALKGLNSSTVGMLLALNPIISFTLAVTYFKEQASAAEFIGYGIVFLAVILFNLNALRLWLFKPKEITSKV